MQKTKRITNRKLLDEIKAQPCAVCKSRYNVDPAHIRTVKNGGPDSEFNVFPLCRRCHSEQHKIGIVTFVQRHKAFWSLLLKHGWEIDSRGKLWNHRLSAAYSEGSLDPST